MTASKLSLTAAQLGIWLGQAIDPESPAYWAAECIELAGPLDVAAFERAHARAMRETEALHLRFGVDDGRPQQWLSDDRSSRLLRLDFSSSPEPERSARSWVSERLEAPVDLARGPLFEGALLRLGPELHQWVFRAHHITLDGYAFQCVQARVAALFTDERAGTRSDGVASTPRLADLVSEDERYRSSAALARDREFWLEHLRMATAPVSLSPLQPLARRTLHERGTPNAALLTSVMHAAHALKLEPSSWLNAAVAAWLARELGVSSYTLGMPVTSRLGSVAVGLPCMAMNIVPLRLRWSAATTFAELARSARDEQQSSRLHQRYRYEDLRQELAARAGGPRRPFGVVVNWMPFATPVFPGLVARKFPLAAGPVEDLAVAFTPSPAGLRVDLEANPNAYDPATLSRCHRALLETLALVAAEPNTSLGSLPSACSVQLNLSSASAEPLECAPRPLLQELVRIARDTPDAPALEQSGRPSFTYAELLRSARSLASQLEREGVRSGERVALLLPRSFEAVVAQLALLWLGAAYLPLDPRGPSARTRAVLQDAAPSLVLTDGGVHAVAEGFRSIAVQLAPRGEAAERDPAAISSECPAYLIYTSGSTGKPNGVVVSRGALDHFVAAARQRYAFSAHERVLQFAPLAFDASVEEIMVTLGSGGTLVLRSESMLESLPGFLREAAELRLSVLDLPTAFFHELVLALDAQLGLPASVRLVIIGGEAALAEHVARFRRYAPDSTLLLNTYGPTEATVVCTTAALSGPGAPDLLGSELPIGVPLPGVSVAVVDADHQLVAIGAEGQLCVLGPTLASGYLGRDELTAQRFVRLQRLRGAPRAYLTGDRVRLNRDGQLVYLGRIDEELKISGYRVNPLEIEAALMALGSVIEAAVVKVPHADGAQLVAFVASREASPNAMRVRSQLAEHVAAQAVPRHVVFVDRLPRDANGKLDRSHLRSRAPQGAPPLAACASPIERQIVAVWRDVLGADVPSLDSDFFALGGHSLLALRVTERLSRELGRSIPLSALFRHPTARALATSLAESVGSAHEAFDDPLALRIALSKPGGSPLFCLPPADGLCWCYLGLARYLPQAELWGLQAPGLRGSSPTDFEALVEQYLCELLAAQPHGPYRLLGWSSGGGLAHALAARLEARGEPVALLALLDAYPSDMWRGRPDPTELDAWVMMLDAEDAASVSTKSNLPSRAELLHLVKKPGSSLADFDDATLLRMSEVALDSMRAYRTARHRRTQTPIRFFRAAVRPADAPDPWLWHPYCAALTTFEVPATHLQMCSPGALSLVSKVLAALL